MRRLRFLAIAMLLGFGMLTSASAVPTKTVVFRGSSGNLSAEIPEDLIPLIEDNKASIEQALQDSNVTQASLTNISEAICKQYDALHSESLYNSLLEGILDVGGQFDKVVPNSQAQQNVWADSLISSARPDKYKIAGGGLNVGLTAFSLDVLGGLSNWFGMDKLSIGPVFLPTLALDARVCGFVLPMDFGVAFSMLDTSKIGMLRDAISPVSFDYLSIGGDLRYAFYNSKKTHLTASGGAGVYYTRSGIAIDGDEAQAAVKFSTLTAFLSAQASYKFHVLVPYIGLRGMLSHSTFDWNANVQWDKILDAEDNSLIRDAIRYNILPAKFKGSDTSKLFENPKLNIYGGLGLELAAFYLTTGLCYDPLNNILSSSFSSRIVF